MENLGRLIKEERKKRKLTQAELGDKVGVCYITICNLEKGRNIGTYLLKCVCDELNLDIKLVPKQ